MVSKWTAQVVYVDTQTVLINPQYKYFNLLFYISHSVVLWQLGLLTWWLYLEKLLNCMPAAPKKNGIEWDK